MVKMDDRPYEFSRIKVIPEPENLVYSQIQKL